MSDRQMTVKSLREVQRASAATILSWVPFEMKLGEMTVIVTDKGAQVDSQVTVKPQSDSQLTDIEELSETVCVMIENLEEIEARLDKLEKPHMVGNPKAIPPAMGLSKAAQAQGRMVDMRGNGG